MKKENSREVKHQKYKELIGYQEIKVNLKIIIFRIKQVGKEKLEKSLENNEIILIKFIIYKNEKHIIIIFYNHFI